MNEYSPQWFETFLNDGDPPRTQREVAYLTRVLPLPDFRRILDVCCGTGRHARGLGASGYDVTGIDRDERALDQARQAGIPGTVFIRADIRELDSLRGTWDAAVIMWASFGYFEAEENRAILRSLRALLRPGARIVLDIYNRSHFEGQPEQRVLQTKVGEVRELRRLEGHRLTVNLEYASTPGGDAFSWEVFDEAELVELARQAGLELIHVCSGFDESSPPSAAHSRMQALFIR